jgi:hypothetical protein
VEAGRRETIPFSLNARTGSTGKNKREVKAPDAIGAAARGPLDNHGALSEFLCGRVGRLPYQIQSMTSVERVERQSLKSLPQSVMINYRSQLADFARRFGYKPLYGSTPAVA